LWFDERGWHSLREGTGRTLPEAGSRAGSEGWESLNSARRESFGSAEEEYKGLLSNVKKKI
jgi:hypothetical protein